MEILLEAVAGAAGMVVLLILWLFSRRSRDDED